jgi:predicted O-methyltransferase YrrM
VSTEAWQRDREQLRRYFDYPVPAGQSEDEYWRRGTASQPAALADQERLFEHLFAAKPGGLFLEVGIGDAPVPARLTSMVTHRIAYTGLDFAAVCERHRPALELAHGHGLAFRLFGNRAGSYLYNLFELARAGESFDIIYFDGHHTMYVDAGPLLLATTLLEPDGVLVVDDIDWSLATVAHNMYFSYAQWTIYRAMYDFDAYEPAQLRERHIGLLVDEILIKRLGFVPDAALTTPNKAVLRRGPR